MVILPTLFILASTPAFAQLAAFPPPEMIGTKQGLPQGFVPGIVQDSKGFIWVATRDGLCRFDGHKFRLYQQGKPGEPGLSSLGLETLQPGPGQKLWITSDQGDIDVFDPVRETFFNYSKQAFYQKAFSGSHLKQIFPDRQNRLWLIFDEPGVARIDLNTKNIKWYHPGSVSRGAICRDLIEDKSGTIWAATTGGLFRIAKGRSDFELYQSANKDFEKIASLIYALKQRHNGDMLLLSEHFVTILNPEHGQVINYPTERDTKSKYDHYIVADSKGTDYFHRMQHLWRFSDAEGLQKLTTENRDSEYKSLFIDQSDVLWAGTNGQGLRKFNLRAGYFKSMPYRIDFVKDLFVSFLDMPEKELAIATTHFFPYNFRYTLAPDSTIWFSVGETPFYKFNPKSKKLGTIQFPLQIKDKRRSDLPVPLATDPTGRIWAVHDSLAMIYQNGSWLAFGHKLRPRIQSGILQIVVDSKTLWVATASQGIYGVDIHSGKIRQYLHDPADRQSLSNNNSYCLFEDPSDQNLLWIGTFGGGLCRFEKNSGKFRRITKAEGLPNDVVYAAIPDRQGHIWAATNQGLSQIDKKTFKVRTFTREDGLMADEFNRFHFMKLPDGRIFLGGVEGITAFDTRQSNEDRFQPLTHITAVTINNQTLEKGSLTGGKPVPLLDKLELSYAQNYLTIEFAGMQFNRADKMRFRYQLQGLEKDWIETENPETKYTDLRPGKYVLRLNTSNTSGAWSPHIRTVAIHILPPWWATWWAYVLYISACLLIGYIFIRAYIKRLEMEQSIAFSQKEALLKEREASQLRRLDEMKTRFFSNITHEFRTPLTLILSPADQMLDETNSDRNKSRLSIIARNARQLLGLVNQLLDLSKLESASMKVVEEPGNLVDFVVNTVQLFEIAAAEKHIVLEMVTSPEMPRYYFDHDKLERILTNLLSNAIKFTQPDGNVKVGLQSIANGVQVTVADTGIGIAQAQLPHIFDRFYQVDTDSPREGTGIGLALVKELAELQGGTIEVKQDMGGYKTVFRLTFPYRRAETFVNHGLAGVETTTADATILLVEDNSELADFIADSLGDTYQFYSAANGAEGEMSALEHMPDLIISDVMMPIMDGYAFCEKIKNNLLTSHIPVILLTAKSATESRLEGLGRGADDYITKPFHVTELNLRVHNLLMHQRRLQEIFRARFASPAQLFLELPKPETLDPFLLKLYAILDSNLENINFGVQELVREIGMSNSTLNRKLKALGSVPAVELIRNYRLSKAAEMLIDGIPVSEAAYRVGFDNLSYFAKCFRDLFEIAPRDYAENLRRK
ncbi:hybrid sensor histidine kinase/response regulator transcription factor [Dyadobacter sp. CY323]|uniref:hybrid sensor histidine kinase/response regulator transcription factor n=1 Tax=Dyadobacter sp. CY323 TaxID=2907302 RepID=UPI001F3D4D50|nr:hybrid sensor histidine kinase/response regulator transcription factor [Dyadobacter sp. CY323]MCE6991402.1 ATP-binding protein [Dyadobacter sp. CY323]